MTKYIDNIVTETQQKIHTSVERTQDGLSVEVRACEGPVDDELKSEFQDEVDQLDRDSVTIYFKTAKTNQGNEAGQDVTVQFAEKDMMDAMKVIEDIIDLGQDFYERQLERNLARESDDGDSNWRHANQQLYFDDPVVMEFCLLYRGLMS